MPPRGRLIAFEGGEASGKSTHARLLAARLNAELTHEPGGTTAGGRIHALVLDPRMDDLDSRAEALLMAADRAQHVARIIEPALSVGRWVVCDRFSGSSLAYQGFGRGLDLGELRQLLSWASQGTWPDLNILIDLPADLAIARMDAKRDRLEREGASFHERVTEGYRTLASEEPETWAVVDGTGSVEEVAVRVNGVVRERLGSV